MKTYYRTVKDTLRIVEEGRIFTLKKDERVLTSEIREGKEGVPVVTVLAGHWVTLPADYFQGGELAYGHALLQ